MKIAILGDGGWGTALAILLSRLDAQICLWGAFPEYVSFLDRERENKKFLPGVKIPSKVIILSNINKAIDKAEIVILAIPAKFMRSVLRRIKEVSFKGRIIVSATKGLEQESLKLMSEVIKEELREAERLCILSGPSHAEEVARNVPTAVVVASSQKETAQKIQHLFSCESFRVYTSTDVIGVQVGGALKNVIAIAVGMCDGLGLGANSKSALITRGLAEIKRLGEQMGAFPSTFAGLSGMGDLVGTCFSGYSRNRKLGEEIGKGRRLEEVLSRTEMVVEGVNTLKAVLKLCKRYKVEMPISQEVSAVLFKNKSPRQAVKDLMLREIKEEDENCAG